MVPTSLMGIFPLKTLRAQFQSHSGFLDARLFEMLNENDFSPDAWATLSMLKIPIVKDLIERLGETNSDSGLDTHCSLIHTEFKNYLTSRGFPLNIEEVKPISGKIGRTIGTIDCSQDTVYLISHTHFDFMLNIASSTCETSPETRWHTKLRLHETSFGNTHELLMRQGDKAIFTDDTTPPLQIEHLGFEGTQAHMRFHSNVMMLKR